MVLEVALVVCVRGDDGNGSRCYRHKRRLKMVVIVTENDDVDDDGAVVAIECCRHVVNSDVDKCR